ncbi:hypothetical protein [Consotaella aegiceratis]|uniref:hypothetical protein n=1 Tax=Consotaella aegiceratis TaxID=3097961 RepID=UPI002F41B389
MKKLLGIISGALQGFLVLLILLMLVDATLDAILYAGSLDFSDPAESYQRVLAKANPEYEPGGPRDRSMQDFYSVERVPTVADGTQHAPLRSETVNITPDGIRLNGHLPVADPVLDVALLGGSQTFGPFINDDETLSARLEDEWPGLSVANFAVPRMVIDESVASWLSSPLADRTDLVLHLAGPLELLFLCSNFVPEDAEVLDPHELRLLYGARRIIHYLTKPKPPQRCDGSPKEIDSMVNRVMADFAGGQAMAEARGVPYVAVLPPMMFTGSANAVNLGIGPKGLSIMRKRRPDAIAYQHLIERMAAQQRIPVIDLTHALDGVDHAYLDMGQHYTAKGTLVLAKALAMELRKLLASGKIASLASRVSAQ